MGRCFFQAAKWLDICGRNSVTLNPEKFNFAEDYVEFVDFEITSNTVPPARNTSGPSQGSPHQRTSLMRSWFGLVNQVSYAFSMAEKMPPFGELLKPSTLVPWNEDSRHSCEESTRAITKEIAQGVLIFDKSKPTCLATNCSKTGICFWLFQKHCTCQTINLFCCKEGWKISLAAKSRYDPIEAKH